MHRELNPKLFSTAPDTQGEPKGSEAFEFPLANYRSAVVPEGFPGHFIEQPARTLPYAPVDIPALDERVEQLAAGLKKLERRDEIFAAKMEELVRSVRENFKEAHGSIVKLDERQRQSDQINETRATRILGKISDSNTSEGKIQEMIDRQNMVIRGFENRLLAMQRVITQQEAALHSAEAALIDARTEIARLKNK